MSAHYVVADYPWLPEAIAATLPHMRGHAFLLHGSSSAGLFEFCLQLAQAWLCESPGKHPDQPACGQCVACHLVKSRTHPDLFVMFPDALSDTLGWQLDAAEVAQDGSEAGSKSRAKPSAEIKVELVRRMIAFTQQTAARGIGKAVVLYPVDKMNLIAANTLLKTLEEPPGSTVRFMLGANGLDTLLPTIRSRCQTLYVQAPAMNQAVQWLTEQGIQDAPVMLAAAGGDPLLAIDMVRQGIDAQAWAKLPTLLLQGETKFLLKWPLAAVLDAVQKLCVDMVYMSLAQATRYFPAANLPQAVDWRPLLAWGESLKKYQQHIDHPLNMPLQLENLCAQSREVLKKSIQPSIT